jgi:hypothetical protein
MGTRWRADVLAVGTWMVEWLHEVVEQREPTAYLQYETAVGFHIKQPLS